MVPVASRKYMYDCNLVERSYDENIDVHKRKSFTFLKQALQSKKQGEVTLEYHLLKQPCQIENR